MDKRLIELLPHRSPMLLLDRFVEVSNTSARSEITIACESPFYVRELGVPSWVALEYMGQTAALIAGFQLEQGTVAPHLGFLLGTRKFKANTDYFSLGCSLFITCEELAVVGDSLATFSCEVKNKCNDELLATAQLSVMRKPIEVSQ